MSEMKYTSHLEQLSVDMFRSSFDELDKNNRWVKLDNLLAWTELRYTTPDLTMRLKVQITSLLA